ncbi:ABC transporter substrate-binding protein [Paenibacillus sinopodophylli]|uniref:ABC transporter substrate-binding protein n=1 Tax=Paenibacillus sinopodophylli TaxID=1837342 RepID=UPI00110CC804|nr:extracellular solute-binding protein [Paenibacillus sinopodophylli]
MTGRRSRRIALIAGLSLLIILLIKWGVQPEGGDSERAGTEVSSAPKPEKVHIQFAQWSVPSTKQVEETISRFNEAHDRIHIDLLNIPLERYIETLNMLNASGKGPDVFELPREWLNSYIIKGWAADLSATADTSFMEPFPEWAVAFSREPIDSDKQFYSIPSSQITYRLIYNKELFREAGLDPEAPPETFAELKTYANAISKAGTGRRKYGMAMPMGEQWMGFVQPMEALNSYSGLYYYDFANGKYDLTVYKPWMDTIGELNKTGGFFPGMENMKTSQAMAQFADGNIGMMIVASWQASLLFDSFAPKISWGIALPPAIDEASSGNGAVKINTAGWNIVNASSKNAVEAREVWQFLYSDAYTGYLFDRSAMLPVSRGLMKQPEDEADAVTAVTAKFSSFFPGSQDSIYPNSPLAMEEWSRKDIYMTVLEDTPGNASLLEESNRLNTILDVAVTAKTVDINRYLDPDFDPRHPMK